MVKYDLAFGLGWRLIFDGVRPLTVKKRAHKFKFEK